MLDGLTLDQMRVFVAVAEAGSFRSAATRLRRAQSAVSHAIASLEAQLGLQLFEREGLHRPVLTADGRVLLADACSVLRRVDALKARARGLGCGAELELQIAVDPLFPPNRIGRALKVVQEAHPAIAVRVLNGTLGAPMQALREGRATIAVTISLEIRDPQIQQEALGPVRLLAVASPKHPLARAVPPIPDAELADHVQIVVSDPSPATEGEDFGVFSPRTWRVGDLATKQAILLTGAGWGSLPEHLVQDDLAAGLLIRLSPSAMGSGRGETDIPAYLAWRAEAALGPAARLFKGALAS